MTVATGSTSGARADDGEAVADDEELTDARATAVSGLSWPRVVAVVAAFAWLAGAVGWFIAQDRPPGPGSVDAGFYLDMIAHHEQGVEMSLIELANGENPVVRGFAQEIVIFQQYEIGRMDEQLRQWELGRSDREEQAMGWMGTPLPRQAMPGLATPEQMDALRSAQGPAADALFLELMAEHHRGGVHMALYAAEHAETEGVRELAARMARNQSIEINEFRQTAERLGLDADIAPYPVDQAMSG